jgi:hypothetical protein
VNGSGSAIVAFDGSRTPAFGEFGTHRLDAFKAWCIISKLHNLIFFKNVFNPLKHIGIGLRV